ncbi:uncharacterized protein A1O9_08581 [Exophiala aquamarina CBS 119918]|uniref:Uncharacterized protein n=1 Tax=Exophiala aquamarina CBS 119918 TaxID=1182545 RepID=A0A072PK11_9EURO|nr:uncharacterized protein A1O9_08581 [Exophiala aquamarina CBS 119918]KEF55830.1 hypothetical protein A1O9_08581 [Exophiala aquamarina CBS 119918]
MRLSAHPLLGRNDSANTFDAAWRATSHGPCSINETKLLIALHGLARYVGSNCCLGGAMGAALELNALSKNWVPRHHQQCR